MVLGDAPNKIVYDAILEITRSLDIMQKTAGDFEVQLYQHHRSLTKVLQTLNSAPFQHTRGLRLEDEPLEKQEPSKKQLLEKKKRRAKLDAYERDLRARAAAGVQNIERSPRADGRRGADIRIDGGRVVSLTPAQEHLLDILEANDGPSPDHLVSFKHPSFVIESLWNGAAMTKALKRALNQRISKMRNSLEASGYSKYLIETHVKMGIRFARRSELFPSAL